MIRDWLKLPHVDEDGYKVAAEYTYLVLNNKLERIPVKFKIELEWEKDDRYEEDSCYNASLVRSDGTVIPFEIDEDGESVDSTGGDYFIKSFFLPELRGQDTADDLYCGYFDLYLELSIDHSRGAVSLFPSLYQSIKFDPVL
jgi:hypothetical protein